MSALLTRFRAGPLKRWGVYWRQLGKDYADAFTECLQESRRRPVKASVYLLGTATLIYAWNTSPSEQAFSDQLVAADARLRMLTEQLRSRAADGHVRQLRQLQADNRLQVQNWGAVSLLWVREYPASAGLHAAQCKHVLPTYSSAGERLLDVGAFGSWWWLRAAMKDYDVNEELFPEDGKR